MFCRWAFAGADAPDPDPPKTVEEFRDRRAQGPRATPACPAPASRWCACRASNGPAASAWPIAIASTPVTADTHFRAGSISKTFIAIGARAAVPGRRDRSRYAGRGARAGDPTSTTRGSRPIPVRVIHLLQHTAGFDDMHFNEIYNVSDPPDLPLEEVLKINPRSRVVRWRPGTRMSYSNPGLRGRRLPRSRRSPARSTRTASPRRSSSRAGMPTSSFVLDRRTTRRCWRRAIAIAPGPPVPYSQIYLRPAGNLHTSALELGRFVHLLLNWGETENELVDRSRVPQQHGAPAHDARVGRGPADRLRQRHRQLAGRGFPMLGHGGGIDGFTSHVRATRRRAMSATWSC